MPVTKEWRKADYEKRKARCIEYLGGKCACCNQIENLEFDHIDRATKVFTITTRMTYSFEFLKPELDKCQLLCFVHHLEKCFEEGSRVRLYATLQEKERAKHLRRWPRVKEIVNARRREKRRIAPSPNW